MPKFLAVDYGLERVGLAISDPQGKMAFPLATLALKQAGTRSALLDSLCALARAENAQSLVVGLPQAQDGSENLTCRQARNFAGRLKRRLGLPLHFMPEFLSSEEALADLREAGVKWRKRKAVLDQQAACRILSSFLALPEDRRREHECMD